MSIYPTLKYHIYMGLFLTFLFCSVFKTVPYCFNYFTVHFFSWQGESSLFFQYISGYFPRKYSQRLFTVECGNDNVRGNFLQTRTEDYLVLVQPLYFSFPNLVTKHYIKALVIMGGKRYRLPPVC